MPKYNVTAPDGRRFTVNAPEGATQEQVLQYAQSQLAQPPAATQRARGTGAISEETDRRAVENAGGAMAALRGAGQGLRDLAAGAIRGAGGIGATIVAPGDVIADAAFGARRDGRTRNQARRAGIDAALTRLTGSDPTSLGYGVGKLGAEVAGTAGVGSALANTGRAVPVVARTAPRVLNAIETGGFALGAGPSRAGAAARLADAGTRALGGAITGGAAAGLVDPENAGIGAAIGGVLPGATRLAGEVGEAAGRVMRGPEQPAALRAAVEQARQAGYVIPPTQARGSLLNRIGEGFAGKLTTAQNASARNQATTNRLAARALGLADDTQITPDVLNQVRSAAGQQYENLAQAVGTLNLGAGYTRALDDIAAPFQRTAAALPGRAPSPVLDLVDGLRVSQIDGRSAVEVVKQLRSQADDAFRAGNTDVGRAARRAATAIENAIESQLASSGNRQALQEFREARRLIARAHTVERALNPATGTIDARALGAQIKRGKPLSDELADAGNFSLAFPKASQPTEAMGSLPQTSPLDWAASLMASVGTQNPLLMLGPLARPGVRAAILSPAVQNNLVQPARSTAQGLLNSLAPNARFLIPPIANDR